MKRTLNCLVFFLVCGLWSLLSLSSAQEQPASQGTPSSPTSPCSKEKKVWTNENISSVQGAVSVVGGTNSGSHQSSTRALETSSKGANFLRPNPGEVFHPGQTIDIDLSVDSDVKPVKALGIISCMGDSNEFREGPPYTFTFTIPDQEMRGANCSLIGFQQLTLFGTVVGRNDYELATTTIDVEESDLPQSLHAVGGMMSQYDPVPNHVVFSTAGFDQRVEILAKFPNGHELDVTESTYLTLASENQAVARVAADGTVTSVGSGETEVIAVYTLAARRKRLSIPVTVSVGSSGLVATPPTIDFGDVPVGASPSQQITVTNRSNGDIKIYNISHWSFPPGTENCSNRTLPVGASCTLNLTFTPVRPGSIHWTFYVENSYDSQITLSLFANGI